MESIETWNFLVNNLTAVIDKPNTNIEKIKKPKSGDPLGVNNKSQEPRMDTTKVEMPIVCNWALFI